MQKPSRYYFLIPYKVFEKLFIRNITTSSKLPKQALYRVENKPIKEKQL